MAHFVRDHMTVEETACLFHNFLFLFIYLVFWRPSVVHCERSLLLSLPLATKMFQLAMLSLACL